MIPEALAGSYQRYKSDTNAFTTWLAKAAESCGYTPPKSVPQTSAESKPGATKAQSLAEKLREKAAKKAAKREDKKQAEPVTSAVKYTVRTQDLLRQAEIVSKNTTRIIIPDSVLRVAGRAVRARKRCTAWFRKTGLETESTDTHSHFIEILENVLQTLSPTANPAEEPHKPASTKEVDIASLSNRFSILTIENAEDILDTTDLATTSKVATNKAPVTKKPTVYELEESLQSQRVFEVFCFFEDLHRIQDYLNQTWSDYKAGELDLMTAAMLTNAAIDMVRRAEQNIVKFAFPNAAPHGMLSYKKLAQLIFHSEAFTEDGRPVEVTKAALRITPFDNFIYLSTARTLYKFEAFRRGMYPHPVPPATMQYAFAQEMLGLPEIKKMDEEDIFLTQWLMDAGYRYGLETTRPRDTPYEKDFHEEITKGFMKLQEWGEVSTWMVFAFRVLQDMKEILGDGLQQSYEELLDTRATVAMQLDVEENGKFSFERGNQWKFSKDNASLLINLHSDCTWIDWVPMMKAQHLQKSPIAAANSQYYHTLEELDHAFPEMARQRQLRSNNKEIAMAPSLELVAKSKSFTIRPIPPSLIPTFVYSSNPTYSGTFAFKAVCGAEEAGIALQNHQQSLFFAATLYNALRQSKLVKSHWIEMDEIIEIHKATWFAGQLPETEDTISKRFDLCLGLSVQGRAGRNFRNPDQPWKLRKGFEYGPQVSRNKVAEIFKPYFAQTKPLEWCVSEVAKLSQQGSSTTTTTTTTVAKKQRHQPQQTPVQLLGHMKAILPQAIKDMKPDYMPLIRICDKLLKKCRSHLNSHLNDRYPTCDATGLVETADLGMVVMVSAVLEDAVGFKLGLERPTDTPQLQMIAPFFEDIIKYRNSGAGKESFRKARQQQDAKIKEMMESMNADFEFEDDDGPDQEGHQAYLMPPRELRGLDL